MTIITTKYDIFELAKDLKEAGVNDKVINAQVKFEKAKEENINAQVKFEKAKDELLNDTLVTKKDLTIEGYKIIMALAVLIPTIMKILEHFKL
jgi:predicted RNA methylase